MKRFTGKVLNFWQTQTCVAPRDDHGYEKNPPVYLERTAGKRVVCFKAFVAFPDSRTAAQ